MKKYKQKRKKFIDDFNFNLHQYKYHLPTEFINSNIEKINIDSWFDINKNNVIESNKKINIKTNFPNEVIKCQKIKMLLTETQKNILNKWFDSYTEMYNQTLNYIRNNCQYFKNEVIYNKLKYINKNKFVNSINLRSELKNIRNEIINKSQLTNINNNTKIQTHTMDYAIRQLVSNIKSAITNLIRGYIKRFRIKFWKNNRPSKTIEIEKQYILNNKICSNILGDIKYEYNNVEINLPIIESNIKINYNKITDEYLLLIPIKIEPTKIENKNRNLISLDPGLRTFMTGLSEKEIIKIGTNVNSELINKIKRLNNIKNNPKISNKIKKKNEKLINRKIYNKVDDLHWKTIKYLTNNFDNILLGDMSAKSIVRKNNSILSEEMKVACLRTRFYEFQQRLQFKCMMTKTNYQLIDENYTSKICSLCGNYNKNLKGEKIYNCKSCKKSIDRDINGCRNIMIKSLMKNE